MGLLRRIYGTRAGQLAPDLRREVEAEGVVLLRERVRGTVTYRHYRRPGMRTQLQKVGMTWALALTERRLLLDGPPHLGLDLPWAEAAFLEVAADDDRVCLAVSDAARLHPRTSGRVELRVRTDDPAGLVATIAALRGRAAAATATAVPPPAPPPPA